MTTPQSRSALTHEESSVSVAPALRLLEGVLDFARERDYTGWDYGDGMSSRVRQWLPFENRWVNMSFQEISKRTPVNVRPLLLVEQRRNYKGTALFAMANLNAHRLERAVNGFAGTADYRREAISLLEWLVDEQCTGYSGFCGGHRHEIQHFDSKGVPNDPDVVSTSYAVRALLAGESIDDRFPEIAETAASFVVDDLSYRPVSDGARINYHLNHDDEVFTINAGALGARLLLDIYASTGIDEYRERGTAILDHVAGLQTERGGWYYRDPPDTSHLSMDNHHNGFVIEAFLRYRSIIESNRFDATIEDALDFYRHTLFDDDGAPNFDESSAYPRDIHASTQGALVFTQAGDLTFAEQILEWAVDNFYAGDHRFYYRKHRFHTKRHVLMRWCQAWMAYALSEFAVAATPDVRSLDESIGTRR